MKSVYDTIIAVRKTSSKNEKLAILEKQKDNADLREFLRVCYEPRINFYISKVPTNGVADYSEVTFNSEFVRRVVSTLHGRVLTGNAAKDWVAACYANFDTAWERELLVMLIERDVKAGFSESTINKVWANTVTDVPYMRCSLPKDAKLKDFPWKKGVFSQIKADGMFANVSNHGAGKITIESRNGSPFPIDAFPGIDADAQANLPAGYQVHGEMLVAIKKMSGLIYLPRQEGNGMLNKLLKGGELPPGHVVIFEAWDMIPLEAAVTKGKYKVPYAKRWEKLQEAMGYCSSIKLIETQIVHSYEEAMRHYQYALSRELEGTIIKHPEMEWKDGTSKEQVKMKLEVVVELKVVGYNEGRNKYVGMLGSLACESGDGKVKVNVAGFTDKQRQEIWDERGLNIIAVKSNSIMPPENKEHYSLFLPIFVEERLDKKKADTLEQIQAQFEAAVTA